MFALELCLRLHKTQHELLDGPNALSTHDLLEWLAYYEILPFEEQDDVRWANLNAMVACKVFKDAKFKAMYKAFLPARRAKDAKAKAVSLGDVEILLKSAGMTAIRCVRPE